ncbi:pollen-specific leucine-rich repeat extensin-like protein 2 isoform X2 [Trichoplusia ni]|uniref:Pollen-specific leucine-rich repeat extensin-like protein 2 isoform X2 n=1 Tax=Trichoplusia ni TaxID=7111 RepID=A0A7E5VR19_TRINI|nr:pollen-specific leucine-rich repeat extensin-like protein 2 isoform X2 [Trichoplusia ni]
MEKEHQPDSMATITMKPEYPPSEVYSTSEPPPAYRQRVSSSVQIARIAALTVVAASFILGAFILASSWVAARSSCHQLEQLDAMLDKELALEGRAYGNDALLADEPLPINNAHALHGVPPPSAVPELSSAPAQPSQAAPVAGSQLKDDALNHAESKVDEEKLQKIDDERNDSPNSASEDSSESDSSAEEEDELDAVRPMFKLPIQFDLDELAGAFLANNQKGRMNCVVEKRRDDPMERRFPFNILGAFAPRSAHAERIAIICHGGDEPRPMSFPEPQSQVFAFPLTGPVRLPLRPQPERAPAPPAAAAPPPAPRLPPFAPLAHRPAPFPLPMPWDSSEEQMGGPREMRIHVQRVIAIPAPHNMPPPPESMGPFAPPPPPQNQDQNEVSYYSQPTGLHQFVPQSAPTQELDQSEVQKIPMDGSAVQMNLPWNLSPEELHMIHRTAEDAAANQRRDQQIDNDMQEDISLQVKTIVKTLAAAAEAEAEAEARAQAEEQAGEPRADMPAPRPPRTLLLPQDMPMPTDERPHYLQPRSVRSVDALVNSEKRVKRCACSCD